MRLHALTPLSARARSFALALAGRHVARARAVAPAAASLAPPWRAGAATWHLHLSRWQVAMQPRLTLALASAPIPAPAPALQAADAPAVDAPARDVAAIQALLRTERVHERSAVELRVAREAQRAVERCRARSRRLDGESAGAAPGWPALPPPPPPPALELRTAPAPGVRPIAGEARLEPSAAPALAALDAHAPGAARREPAALPWLAPAPADVERLAESVLDVIDRRVTAHRERLGRP